MGCGLGVLKDGLFLRRALLLRGSLHGVTIARRATGDTHSRTGRYGLSETVVCEDDAESAKRVLLKWCNSPGVAFEIKGDWRVA